MQHFKQKFGCDSTTVCLGYARGKYKSNQPGDVMYPAAPCLPKDFLLHSLCPCGTFFEASCFKDFFWGIISVTDKILCFRSFTAKTPKNMVTWLFPRGAVCLCSFLVYLRSGTCRRPYPSWSTKGELSDTNSCIKFLHHRKFHHLGLCWLKWRRGNFPVCDVKTVAMLRYWFCCRLQVYPLHSTVTLEEQNGVFLKPVHGFRKVKTWFFSFFMFCL